MIKGNNQRIKMKKTLNSHFQDIFKTDNPLFWFCLSVFNIHLVFLDRYYSTECFSVFQMSKVLDFVSFLPTFKDVQNKSKYISSEFSFLMQVTFLVNVFLLQESDNSYSPNNIFVKNNNMNSRFKDDEWCHIQKSKVKKYLLRERLDQIQKKFRKEGINFMII